MYKIQFFSGRAIKEYSSLNDNMRYRVDKKIGILKNNPFPTGSNLKKRLKSFIVADFRIRTNGHRILYDVDEANKKVLIISIRKKNKATYK